MKVGNIVLIFGLLFGSCALGNNHQAPIYEPSCSQAYLAVPMPPIWSLNNCWDECCMYSYMGCQQTYCYWSDNYDCYWEIVEIYCW